MLPWIVYKVLQGRCNNYLYLDEFPTLTLPFIWLNSPDKTPSHLLILVTAYIVKPESEQSWNINWIWSYPKSLDNIIQYFKWMPNSAPQIPWGAFWKHLSRYEYMGIWNTVYPLSLKAVPIGYFIKLSLTSASNSAFFTEGGSKLWNELPSEFMQAASLLIHYLRGVQEIRHGCIWTWMSDFVCIITPPWTYITYMEFTFLSSGQVGFQLFKIADSNPSSEYFIHLTRKRQYTAWIVRQSAMETQCA